MILNRSKDYYKNNQERLREQAKDKHRNLSEEEKIKKENMKKIDVAISLKRRKKRLKEYQKIIARQKISIYNNKIK